MANQTGKNFLRTIPPGCGKTMVIRRLVERLANLRLVNFCTEELREQGQRVGFKAICLSDLRAVLAHVQVRSRHRAGRYGIDAEQLRPLAQEELAGAGTVADYLVDEVGRMELLCPAFVEAVLQLLDGPIPIVMTDAQKGQGLIAQVKARADVRLVLGNDENRNRLAEELERWVRAGLRSR